MRRSRPVRRLLPAERKLWNAFPTRSPVDLRAGDAALDDPANSDRWGRDRVVRGSVLAALLLGVREPQPGRVPGIRLVGARIVGRLDLYDGVLSQSLRLDHCDIEETIVLTDATTKGIQLRYCRIHRLHAGRADIDGDITLKGSTVAEGVHLADAHVTGQVRLGETRLGTPTKAALLADDDTTPTVLDSHSKWAVWAGGITVDGGFFGRRLHSDGGIRLVGARLNGGLHMQRATVIARGVHAIEASHVEAPIVELSAGFTAKGTVRFRGARISGVLSFDRARLAAPERVLHLSHAQIDELILLPDSIEGEVNLSYTRLGVLFDQPSTYPEAVRLTGTTYEQLRGRWTVAQRRAWVDDRTAEYRPQPYEQLAAWYRTIGNEPEARMVLLAKQRRRRRTLHIAGRLWGWLLDIVVGYGYRPWLAGAWALALLTTGTLVFHHQPPSLVPLDEERTFHPFVYTLDLLVPVSVFEQRGVWEPVGWTRWLAWGIVMSGWILATALIAGATRVLRPTGASG